MDEAAVVDYLLHALPDVDRIVADGDSYFYYNPGGDAAADCRFPFATLVTGDRHDQVSQLDRPGVFRLNVGVSKQSFQTWFGPEPFRPDAPGDYDFAALDRLLPHPVYGNLYWLCVLNPGPTAWEQVQPLLREAYDAAVRKQQAGAAPSDG